MKKPPPLTDTQKIRFGRLKKQLLTACRIGDVQGGKVIIRDIKNLLVPTGHNIKYYEMLLHLCEMLLLKKEYGAADFFLSIIANNTGENTRIYQEANILLAICKMNLYELEESASCIKKAFDSKAIKKPETRQKFIRYISELFEEESLLTSFRSYQFKVDAESILNKIQKRYSENTQDEELLEEIGKSVPKESIEFMKSIREMAKKQLVHHEQKMLPPSPGSQEFIKLGKRVFGGLSRRLWIIICPPDCKIQKILESLQNPIVVATAIMTEMSTQGFGLPSKSMFAGLITIIIKKGVNRYCTKFKPRGVMEHRYQRS